MKPIDVTNLILKKAYKLGLDLDTKISLLSDGIEPDQPIIQINIRFEYLKSFAFYYALNDKYFAYSSPFLVNNNKEPKAKELFNKEEGIFTKYTLNDVFNYIELSNEIEFDLVTEEYIDSIFDYLLSEHELITYLNSISNGRKSGGRKYDVTNLLIEKLYQSDLDVELCLSVDNSVADAVQIQFNFYNIAINDFAIFYGTRDEEINYCSIYEVQDKHDEKALQLFNDNKGIYKSFILDDYDEMIHLYTNINIKDVDEEIIDIIVNYISTEHELNNYLISISR